MPYNGNGSTAAKIPANPVIVEAARVLAVGSGGSADSRSITVLIPAPVAPEVANYASSGNLAVSILPDDTKPTIDTQKN